MSKMARMLAPGKFWIRRASSCSSCSGSIWASCTTQICADDLPAPLRVASRSDWLASTSLKREISDSVLVGKYTSTLWSGALVRSRMSSCCT